MTSTPTEALTKAEKELEATAFAYAATAKPEHRSEILDRLSVPGVCLFLLDAVSLLKQPDETHALEPAEVANRLPKKTKSKLGETKSGEDFLNGTNPGFGEGEEALEQLEERRADRKVFANLTAAVEGRTELEEMRKLAASLKKYEDKKALGVLQKDIDAKSAAVRALFIRVAAPPSSDGEEDLKALWKEHKEQRLQKDEFAPHEALMLSPRRGKLGRWFNDWFGPAGALEPGRTVMVGAPPGTGKTGFASMLAADAMESGCPVLFAQMELSVPETLEHVAAQAWPHTGTKTAPSTADSSRNRLSDFQFPATWLSLLRVTYPSPLCNEEVLRSDRILWRESGIYTRRPPGSMEAIIWDMRRLASKSERARRAGRLRHGCNGLVVVDYAQLLTVGGDSAPSSSHEIMTLAASTLARVAADHKLVLCLLSQMTKEAQKGGGGGATGFSGGDINRAAHVSFTMTRAREKCGNEKGPVVEWEGRSFVPAADGEVSFCDDTHGEARIITRVKSRGCRREGLEWRTMAWVRSRAILDAADSPHANAAPQSSKVEDDYTKFL